MQQYMIDKKIEVGKEIEFDKDQSHHIKDVMRMKEGNRVRVVFPTDKQAGFASIEYKDKKVVGTVVEVDQESHELSCIITLCIGLLKKEKWEYMLQKVTELGVSVIVPFESQRTVVKNKEEKQQRKQERWNKILMEASEQSKREVIPKLLETHSFKELIEFKSDLNLVAYEDVAHNGKALREFIQGQESVTLVIGPEGGFSSDEIDFLCDRGFHCTSLGKRILRAETAAAHGVSLLVGLME